MVFVEEAFKKMKKGGRGCVIIKDSAGSGQAKDININILKHNTLKASIKMPGNLFKASVQTSIYLFETGLPIKNKIWFNLLISEKMVMREIKGRNQVLILRI